MRSQESQPSGESRIIRQGKRRIGKLLGLQGYSTLDEDGIQVIDENRLYDAMASFLASKHFNERRGDILPRLPKLLDGCDFYWGYEYRDGQQQGLEATRQLLQAIDTAYYYHNPRQTGHHQSNNAHPLVRLDSTRSVQQAARYLEPFAIYGAFWSRVSKIVTAVSSALEIPYISGVSTSPELIGTPLFARTGLSSDGDARAAMLYYRELGIRHVAVLYINDSWGIHFHKALDNYANQWGIILEGFPYDPNQESIERSLIKIRDIEFRHVFAVMHNWREVLPVAYDQGVVGNPDYAWMTAETSALASRSFQLNRRDPEEAKLAKALHGIGTLNAYFTPNLAFEQAMGEFANNKTLQDEFIAIQEDPTIFENYTFPEYVSTGTATSIFDAVLALGITACNASNNLPDLFTGTQFYEALKTTSFRGVSGRVTFDPMTGVRVVIGEDVRYSVQYVALSEERSTSEMLRFESNIATIVQGDNNVTNTMHPFIYNDNTSNVPLPLPPIEGMELNLLPVGVQAFGYLVAGMELLFSLLCFLWTALNRNVFVLKASQPFFLCQLCVGLAITSLSIFTWSLPLTSTVQTTVKTNVNGHITALAFNSSDDTAGLDTACMSTFWLVFVGFSIVFSALASKTWRLHQLLQTGSSLRRSRITVFDCMWPLYVSLSINVTLLLCITLISPLQYERVKMSNFDAYGRSLESFGACQPANGGMFYLLSGTLVSLNVLGVALVTWITYKLRHAPVDFSDAYNLALTMMSLLETLSLGGPLLVVVEDDPAAFYMVGSSLIGIGCMTILVLVFVPKFMGRKRHHRVQSVVNALHPRNVSGKRHGGSPLPSSASSVSGDPVAAGRMPVFRQKKAIR
ncbi:Gamma-aminobutyric acid (GABA) B receptor [Seminavis robusta]|uniref:Gamma-aminobutyric acid (GABA) B receptor n=1 Tax=Seminavis robusta TaxID=568900 RepID=A0A9N8DR96_9STRA|nr:Gamma-aminobutyric acid (GABA) B receptor [Seminavis robusta]|eukprot:Sro295_g110530.1 Gamma-aminobutyric acid (GABA) B receptor (856) ;mRNA; f:68260-70827